MTELLVVVDLMDLIGLAATGGLVVFLLMYWVWERVSDAREKRRKKDD